MTPIETYYDLLYQQQISDFKVSLFAKNLDEKEDLTKEQVHNAKLHEEIAALEQELSKPIADADNIRIAFIHVANGVLESFKRIQRWGAFYPDLSQGMVVPGFLFGKIIHDFNTALKYEGGLPVVDIYMSQDKWDYTSLRMTIEQIHKELFERSFSSKMEAIEYYEQLRQSILNIADELRKQRII